MPSFTALATAAIAVVSTVCGSAFTSCNPTNASCSPDVGLSKWSYSADFTGADAASLFAQSWNAAPGTKVTFGSQGMLFNISNYAQAPTVTSNFTFLFGRIDVKMQAAPSTGVISSVILQSNDLDEVDVVVMGGNTTSVETNYYGKGSNNVASYIAANTPQTQAHTYSIDWTSSSLVWSIDGQTVRTLAYSDATGGDSFPQTPMALKLGSWDGGKPGGQPGTTAWAGGLTDFSKGPFVAYIESVTITNYNPANFYLWSDQTGSFLSIKASNITSDVNGISDAGSVTASSIVGGPTLVTATAGSAQGAAATGANSIVNSGASSSSKGFARRLEVNLGLGFTGTVLGLVTPILAPWM